MPDYKPDERGIHPLAKPIGEAYKTEDERLRDPASILASITGNSGGANAGQPWKYGRKIASHSQLVAWAARNRRELDPEVFAGLSPHASGGEHIVYYTSKNGRVVKATKPGFYGAQAEDAGAYLQRHALANRVFRDDVRFEGMVHFPDEGEARAVISQPFILGRDSTPEEQLDRLMEGGFRDAGESRFVHPVIGVSAWDTITPGNAITAPDGRVSPIDLQLEPSRPEELARIRKACGMG